MAVIKPRFAWCDKTTNGWTLFVRHEMKTDSHSHLVFTGEERDIRDATDGVNVAFDAALKSALSARLSEMKEKCAKVAEGIPCHHQTGNAKYAVNLTHEIAAAIRALEVPK